MNKPIYNKREWVLGQCSKCGWLNYVEPHGTTAACKCSREWTKHTSIPYEYRDKFSGTRLVVKPPFIKGA